MSFVSDGMTQFLLKLSAEQKAYGNGRIITNDEGFPFASFAAADIHTALDRSSIHTTFEETVTSSGTDAGVGKAMTAVDESDMVSSYERAVQRSHTSRIRNMAHAMGRAKAHSSPSGLINYTIPELLARPDA